LKHSHQVSVMMMMMMIILWRELISIMQVCWWYKWFTCWKL